MGLFSKIVKFIKRHAGPRQHNDNRRKHIFLKIVDINTSDNTYKIQCVNSSSHFYSTISEIISDIDLLYSLHPAQACYIGIECIYNKKPSSVDGIAPQHLNHYRSSRYGRYDLTHHDRDGKIGFLDKYTKKSKSLYSDEISADDSLISEFDAIHAFFIGIQTGKRLIKAKRKRPQLRLIA